MREANSKKDAIKTPPNYKPPPRGFQFEKKKKSKRKEKERNTEHQAPRQKTKHKTTNKTHKQKKSKETIIQEDKHTGKGNRTERQTKPNTTPKENTGKRKARKTRRSKHLWCKTLGI